MVSAFEHHLLLTRNPQQVYGCETHQLGRFARELIHREDDEDNDGHSPHNPRVNLQQHTEEQKECNKDADRSIDLCVHCSDSFKCNRYGRPDPVEMAPAEPIALSK
jgi:hypothetical protein